jgi:hypothetical protein
MNVTNDITTPDSKPAPFASFAFESLTDSMEYVEVECTTYSELLLLLLRSMLMLLLVSSSASESVSLDTVISNRCSC